MDGAAPFCGSCGARQPGGPSGGGAPRSRSGNGSPFPSDFTAGISPRTASILCYIPWFGWIAAIIVIASPRFKRDLETRFHAFQGLYLFVAWLVINMVVQPALRVSEIGGPMFPFPRAGAGILELLILVSWIVMLVKTSKGQHYRLPLIGEWAERTVNEQRV